MTGQLPLLLPVAKPPPKQSRRCLSCEWFSGTKCHESVRWVERDPRAHACDKLVVRGLATPEEAAGLDLGRLAVRYRLTVDEVEQAIRRGLW